MSDGKWSACRIAGFVIVASILQAIGYVLGIVQTNYVIVSSFIPATVIKGVTTPMALSAVISLAAAICGFVCYIFHKYKASIALTIAGALAAQLLYERGGG